MVNSTAIILNDLRSVPLLTALKLNRNIPSSYLVAHASIFECKEYADHTNILWKLVLKFVFVVFFGLKIIRPRVKDLAEDEMMGVWSSLFSITEDSGATEEKYPKIYHQIAKLAMGSKDVIDYLMYNKNDSVFIFNGRTASSYLITKFCVTNNILLCYYEYAGHCNGFRLFPVAPHASGSLGELIYNYYIYGVYNIADLKDASVKYIESKLNSDFAKNNKKKPSKKYDVAIFLSSDFEYTSIDPDICGVTWNDGVKFCRSVIEKYGEHLSYAIRCHPNSIKDPNWINLIVELRNGLPLLKYEIDLYGPDVAVDSHELILAADLVVTDLSTISMDAILLGKPVDIFGNTDIKHIYTDPWMNSYSENNIQATIAEPFSLQHNFLVFRFSKVEKIVCFLLFAVHRSFAKYESWSVSCCRK